MFPTQTLFGPRSVASVLVAAFGAFSCAGGELLDDVAGVCGDNVRQANEECDDGNTRSGDGCNSRCETEGGGGDVVCGDGLIGGREACDDGDTEGDDGCSALCGIEAGFTCEGEPSVCTPAAPAVCGDGTVDSGEGCDDGDTDGGDGCSASCAVEDGFACTGAPSGCSPVSTEPQCGNGAVEGSEGCDDGNLRGSDGCSPACNVEPGFTCTGSPSVCEGEPVPTRCGNGIVEGSEGCDDGDRNAGDGCTGNCFVEEGFECTGSPSVCVSTVPICGNGILEDGEDCDDGDTSGDDGCSATCDIEDDWTCVGEPSVCTPPDRCAGVDCSGLDTACSIGVCSALTGLCEQTARDDGTTCDDGDPCTSGDTCRAGACSSGGPLDCSSLTSPCGTGVCDREAGGCVAVPAAPGATCDTNPNDCVTATCEEGLCVQTPLPDCSNCGAGSLCAGGECIPINPVTRWSFEAATPPPEFRFTGSPQWSVTSTAWADGTRSLRSGAIGGSTSTTATLPVTVNRPVTLRFAYTTSTEASFDELIFTINGTERLRDSGYVDWTEVSYPLPAGTHTLVWTYRKDGSWTTGADAVFIDAIVLEDADTCAPDTVCGAQLQTPTTCLACPNAAAADGPCNVDNNACTVGVCTAGACVEPAAPDCSACPGGTCLDGVCRDSNRNVYFESFEGDTAPGVRVGGRSPWAIWEGAGRDGSGAGRSGDLAGVNSVESWAEVTVTLPAAGSLEFWYRVSSESGYDWLELLVNGTRVDRWSGEVGWTRYTRALPAGAATIRWRYTKDGSAAVGSDAAWIDDVRVSVPCTGAAECAISVGGADACVECPAADGTTCAGGTCAAGVCQ